MKKTSAQFIVSLFATLLLSSAAVHAEKLLLMGNSLCYFNNLKATIQGLATAGGHTLTVTTIASGGKTLGGHWNDKVADSITAGSYDYVSLQEHSWYAMSSAGRLEFAEFVPLFDSVITESGGKTLLYMTWSYSNNNRLTNTVMFDAIDSMYTSMGRQIGADVVPAGCAYKNGVFENGYDSAYLYVDHVHPTPAGSYLVACTFYSTIYKETPEDLDFFASGSATLSATQAAELQALAWSTYQEYTGGSVDTRIHNRFPNAGIKYDFAIAAVTPGYTELTVSVLQNVSYRISITDAAGKSLSTRTGTAPALHTFDIQSLPPGAYFVHTRTKDNHFSHRFAVYR